MNNMIPCARCREPNPEESYDFYALALNPDGSRKRKKCCAGCLEISRENARERKEGREPIPQAERQYLKRGTKAKKKPGRKPEVFVPSDNIPWMAVSNAFEVFYEQ